ncbi:hypothetical protein B0H14DRAFT_2579413 [Mycena olivaceomarginata]|nr:hypothetical protein B0H14DRAFT_2579413 [Mycena olivaceomarginata]
MFSGIGFQIHGGNFYNVGGDVNLHTHQHLTIQFHESHATTFQSLVTSNQGLGDGLAARSQPQLTIQDELYEVAFQSPSSTLGLEDGQAEGCERKLVGVARNSLHGMAARTAPYGMASSDEVSSPRPSSWDASALIPAPPAPSSLTSFPDTNTWSTMIDALSQYFDTYPESNGTRTLDENSGATDYFHRDFLPADPRALRTQTMSAVCVIP